MSATAGERGESFVLTLEDIGNLTRESGKPVETLMNIVALIADRFQTTFNTPLLLFFQTLLHKLTS